jgi:phytoene dehydrogenase-like protein
LRSFRGVRQEPLAPAYDAVVVGAGIGGLIAANLLARAGLTVLLVEQHYMVGGYCSTFRRKGYTFDASTHFYPLLGNPETLTGRLLGELGCRTRWVKMDPVDTFHFPDGSRFEVPADFDTYMARLCAEFPAERAAIDGFFAAVRKAYLEGLLYYFRGKDQPGAAATRALTLREVLDRTFRDPKLALLLTADCPHWGSPPGRTSFVFDSMLRLSYFLGNYYPEGGSQAFADDLARCLEERGGQILMRSPVTQILVEDGAARGVEIEVHRGQAVTRERVRCGVVVSNADLLATLEDLVGERHLPAGALESVRALRPTFPCYLLHLGLRGVEREELERAQGYYWDGWDMDRVGRDALRCKLFSPTLYEPAMAPPGRQVLIVQKVQELDYAAVEDWSAHRASVDRFLWAHLDEVLPGARAAVETATSASALTAWRFTRNHHGAMLGWEMSPDQLGPARPAASGLVRDLHLVGHWTQPGGGITPVIVSAQRAAQAILAGRAAAPEPPWIPAQGRT